MKSVTRITVLCVAVVALLCPGGRAHGTLESFTADGTRYIGPLPLESGSAPSNTSIRQIQVPAPIMSSNIASADMTCGPGAAPSATFIAPVTAGSNVSFHYRNGNGGPWIHNVGPVMTYMYKCPDGTPADKCAPAPGEKGWFKIDAKGFENSTTWFQSRMMVEDEPLAVTVPANIPDGDYLVRYEVISLQNANTTGYAEFYVSCTQVHVIGGTTNQTAAEQGAELVAFPGTYGKIDPGIHVDVYDIDYTAYEMPGPAVFGQTSAAPTDAPAAAPSTPSRFALPSPPQSDTASSAPATTSTPACQPSTSKRALRRYQRMFRQLRQGRTNPGRLRAPSQG